MEVRHKCKDLDWGGTQHGCSWDLDMGICMGVRCEYGDLDGFEMRTWWRRDANLWTLMEVRRLMDGGETRILWPGFHWNRTWVWDGAWVELKCNLWGPECRWHRHRHRQVLFNIQVRHNLVVVQRQIIYGPGFKWPEWIGDVNLGA